MLEIRRMRVEIKQAQIESATGGGWVVGLYVGVSHVSLLPHTCSGDAEPHRGGTDASPVVCLCTAESTWPLSMPLHPASLLGPRVSACRIMFLTDGTEEADFQVVMSRHVKLVKKASWNIPYIHLEERKTESWEVVEPTVYHVQAQKYQASYQRCSGSTGARGNSCVTHSQLVVPNAQELDFKWQYASVFICIWTRA